mgnify:FL=1
MTLFELLHKVSFDDLIPTLKEVYDVETDIYAYREAFDELNLLRPTGRGEGDYRSATLYESIFKYGLLPQSEHDSVVIVLYSSDAAKVSPSLRSAVEDLLITGRTLKRSVIKVCSDPGITDGSIRAFIVTSKDEN